MPSYSVAGTLISGLNVPFDICVDPTNGDIYFTERGNNRISKLSGGVRTTYAGTGTAGFADGAAATARFSAPMGIARDAAGNIYVGDESNHRIRKITPDGTVSTVVGTGTAGAADGPAATATIQTPNGVAVDDAGNLYIVERNAGRTRKLDIATGTVSTLVTGLNTPANCRVTPDGATLYVADQLNDAIRRIDVAAKTVTPKTWGSVNGPCGVELDLANGKAYAGCFDALMVYEIDLATGVATSIAGTGANAYRDGPAAQAQFQRPVGVALHPWGLLLVGEYDGGRIRYLADPAPVADTDTAAVTDTQTELGGVDPWYVQTRAAGLTVPFDIAVDPDTGDIYVAERTGHRISKITRAGVRTVFAGSGTAGFADGSATTARFNYPMGITRDAAGNLYVGDESNHRIRKVTPDGTVSTIAGTGTAGFADGPAATAQFSGPNGVAVDAAGVVYVVEKSGHRVRKYDPATGNVTLVAGSTTAATGNVNGDGSAARFYNPANCQVTPDGATMYVADQSNGAIRKIDLAANTVSTYASVLGPVGVEIDPLDNTRVYAASFDSRRVYEIPKPGWVVSIAGTGVAGFVDNTYGDKAQFARPVGLGITPQGVLLVADYDDGRVRVLVHPDRLRDDHAVIPLVDDESVPYVSWPDNGTVTESAEITFRAVSSADTGKVTDAGSVTYRSILAADTATCTEATRFDDPNQGPPSARSTGTAEQGTFAAAGSGASAVATNFATVTVNPGELLLVSMYGWSQIGNAVFTTLTGLGMTWTRLNYGTVTGAGGTYRLATFWGHYTGDAPATGTLSASGGGASGVYSVAHVVGHDPARPIPQTSAPGTFTLSNPPAVSSRSFAVVANGNANTPVPRANWQTVGTAVGSNGVGVSNGQNGGLYMAVATHWRPDTYEANATPTSTYNYGYAFEIQPPGTPIAGADTGTVTDEHSEPIVWWAETGTFTDDAVVLAPKAGADTGKATETALVAVAKTSWDAGVIDEGTILGDIELHLSDDASATEDAAIQVDTGSGDSAADKETATVHADVSDTDSGVVTDDSAPLDSEILAVGDNDSASPFTEDALVGKLQHGVNDTDTGRFDEDAHFGSGGGEGDQVRAVTDGGAFTDEETTLRVTFTASDTGALADTHTDPVEITFDYLDTADTATVTEDAVAAERKSDADTATAIDTDVVGRTTAPDTAGLTESAYVYPVDPVRPDAGTRDRIYYDDTAVSVNVHAHETGTVSEQADLFEVSRDLTDTDTGRWRERLAVLLIDIIGSNQRAFLSDDQGWFIEATESLPGATQADDTNTLSDDAVLSAGSNDGDAAAFTAETGQLLADIRGADTARLVIEDAQVAELSSPTVGQLGHDAATFTELTPVIALTAVDTGALTDSPRAIVGPRDSDSATAADQAQLLGLRGDDTATVDDTGDPRIALSDADTGHVDDPAPSIAITADDAGTATDTETVHASAGSGDLGGFGEGTGEFRVQVPAADDTTATDGQQLFAEPADADTAALADTAEDLLVAARHADTPTITDAEDLHAAVDDTATGRLTEAALLYTEAGIGAFTGEDARHTEDQTLSAQLPAGDTGTLTDTQQLLAGTTGTDTGQVADGQALNATATTGDTGRIAEAALLHTETGDGAFTGEDGRIGETATLTAWDAFAYPHDDQPVTVTETQSVYRRNPDQPWIEFRPGSLLKVNVATRRTHLSDYFTADEYPISRPLPADARFKLDAFGAQLSPAAKLGDELEDADFRYRYEARWLTPNRRETGWYIVAWRRPSGGPDDWLA